MVVGMIPSGLVDGSGSMITEWRDCRVSEKLLTVYEEIGVVKAHFAWEERWVDVFDFPHLGIFCFCSYCCFCCANQGSPFNLGMGRLAHQPCIRSRPWRNHDCCFELPRDRGRQGTHSQSRGFTTPQRSNRAYPACEPEALSSA